MFLTRVYLSFTQFPTFHFGLDHSGSQPFIIIVVTYTKLQCASKFRLRSTPSQAGLLVGAVFFLHMRYLGYSNQVSYITYRMHVV